MQNTVFHLGQVLNPWCQAAYSRGPFMAAMFLLVFWILFSGHDEAGLSLWLLNVLLAFV